MGLHCYKKKQRHLWRMHCIIERLDRLNEELDGVTAWRSCASKEDQGGGLCSPAGGSVLLKNRTLEGTVSLVGRICLSKGRDYVIIRLSCLNEGRDCVVSVKVISYCAARGPEGMEPLLHPNMKRRGGNLADVIRDDLPNSLSPL